MRSGWNLLALALLFSVAWTPVSGAGEPAGPDLHGEETLQRREARMAWWREAKFGLFVHWGPVSLTGKELSWSRQGPRPSDHQALQEIRQAEYEFFHGQIRELLGNYGKVDILWFDHVGGNWRDWRFRELYAMIRQLQPEIVINNRGAAFVHRPADNPTPEIARLVRGDFDTPEQQLGRFSTDRAWESCITLVGGQWAYKPEGKMYTLPECIGMLVQCVTGDGNLLLNVGPMPSGKIERRQVERLKEIGQWLRQYGNSIYGTRGGPWSNGPWGGSTRKGNTVYVHILRWGGDSLKLSPLAHKIMSHRMLTGGEARVEQTAQRVAISVPVTQRHAIDTIVALELDAPPGLSVLSPLDYQVFQRNTRLAGQVLVRGGVRGDCDSVRVRLTGKPLEGKLDPTLTAFVKTVGPNQWEAEGTLFDGLMKRINQLGPHGLRAVLWHQGESDAGQARAGYPADRQITGQQYRRYMEKLILACQAQAGWKIPWLTAQATYHGPKDPSDAEFRQAQKSLGETGIALQGPDTDTLKEPYRDGVHFNGKGLQAHGRMWAEKVGAYLNRGLK